MSKLPKGELEVACQLAGADFKYIRSIEPQPGQAWKHVFERTAVFVNSPETPTLRGYAHGVYWARVRRVIEHGAGHVPTDCRDTVLTASPINAVDGQRFAA